MARRKVAWHEACPVGVPAPITRTSQIAVRCWMPSARPFPGWLDATGTLRRLPITIRSA